MSTGTQVRLVNVVPLKMGTKIKVEPLSETEEVVSCRICMKGFASDMALRNHVRMEHIEAFETGDPNVWTAPVENSPVKKKRLTKIPLSAKIKEDPAEIKKKTEQIFSSMTPGNLMSLASNDVSYIIIKSEETDSPPEKKKKVKVVKVNQQTKETVRKQKEPPQPITGPFECVQPSNTVAEGVCHQIFFSCCEYSAHFRDEHTRRRKGLRCQVCEKPLLQQHEGRAPYTCEVCGAGFSASKELSAHTSAAHVKLKPFQCSICLKRFTQQGGVQQHMRMHTGDRPFSCTFCPKSFTQKSGLDQHIRIHTKVRPYRCVICGKTFCQSVHLKQHMRTHTNVSPFQCGICQKRFKQSSHLNYHLRNHNPANMTDDQKQKYEELVGMMSKEIVQVEIQSTETEETEETMETTEICEDMEQVVAAQNIQMVDGEYILGDDVGQTWRVEMAEN
ncbi:zinc finger protein 778-like [Ostrinia nubilalis]|uniref:zinc finger protein 778-like n=1 Tax=Ostrinia nubilalis TaxID=29057 RepID=UPI0030823E86